MAPWRLGIVVPRYGSEILGGAETLAREFGERLVGAGLAEVQVLTTCARNHLTWKNELTAGEETKNGVRVRRFPVDHTIRNRARYEAVHLQLVRGEIPSRSEQYQWVHESAHSPQLYAYLDSCRDAFDFVLFIPYLFGTTFYGSAVDPSRSILWPCLHNETYAFLDPTRDMYHRCLGVMFNTFPEARLARRLYGDHPGAQIVGFGMDETRADGQDFRKRHHLREPFILYSGRLESAKNIPLLLDFFAHYKQRRKGDLKLVLMGQGPESIRKHPDIVHLGFKQGREKMDVYAAAAILCQPSVNESFSIVMMEGWLGGAPALVHADCEVTRYNAIESNGGLYFRTYEEFEAAVDLLVNDHLLHEKLAENGKKYVRANFSWSAVLERFELALRHWSDLRGA